MSLDASVLVVFAAAGLATYLMRAGGLVIAARLKAGRRVNAALEAVPAAVLTAVVAPAILAHGLAEFAAGVATMVAATRLPLLAVVLVGLGAVVAARALTG